MATVSEKMTAIADAIRDKTGSIDALTLDGMAEEISNVYEAGKQAQCDEFWDVFQDNGKRTNYNMGFAGVGWNDATFKPKYKIKPVESAHRMFQNSTMSGDLREYGVEFDFSECQALNMAFYNTKFKKIGVLDTRSTTTLDNTFGYASVETIEKFLIKDDGTSPLKTNTFAYCSALCDITIEGKIGVSVGFAQSSKLTYDSLMSIINALYDYTGTTTTYTLTLHATSKSKLSESDIATITQKGWTLA